jgi:hypothetical protein
MNKNSDFIIRMLDRLTKRFRYTIYLKDDSAYLIQIKFEIITTYDKYLRRLQKISFRSKIRNKCDNIIEYEGIPKFEVFSITKI